MSPAFDINPNPDSPGRLSTTIDRDSAEASIDIALSVAESFRLSQSRAGLLIFEIEAATRGWRQEAQALGLLSDEVDRMAVAFESEQRRFARALGTGGSRNTFSPGSSEGAG